MISISNLIYKIGAEIMYDSVNLDLLPGVRYAITGPNGSGKTTLLKLIAGDLDYDGGQIKVVGRIGFLRQHFSDSILEETLLNAVIMGNGRLWRALTYKEQLLSKSFSDDIGFKLGECEDVIQEENGYESETEASKLLKGLGFTLEQEKLKLWELTNGDKLKVLLAQSLFGNPAILILDEPTNFVDIFGLDWLKSFLVNDYKGVLIFTSHDVHFVNDVATMVADIDYGSITLYTGNYNDMLTQKEKAKELEEKAVFSQQKQSDKLKAFIGKFGAGTRASQAKSRQKALEKLDLSDVRRSIVRRPYIFFDKSAADSGMIVLKAHNISKEFDGQKVVSGSWEIRKGDKIAVVGINGIGKTTLIKLLIGEQKPDQGTIEIGPMTRIGYFPQNVDQELNKYHQMTIYDWLLDSMLRNNMVVSDQELRSTLGKMLFSGADASKKIGVLSGGEKVRILFAKLMILQPNLLVLDEPTSHLDIETVIALEKALIAYNKTLLLVTHNKIGNVCDKICLLHKKHPNDFAIPKWYYGNMDMVVRDHYK